MDKILIILGIVCFIAFMLWLMWKIYSGITARRIMREGRKKRSFAYNYLSVRFGRGNAIKDVRLPMTVTNPRARQRYADVGLLFVNRGGIFVINSVAGSGFIENVQGGKWVRSINDKQFVFDDPFVQNISRVRAVKEFLRKERIDNVPVHSIVLLTGMRVKYARRMNGLITADELEDFMLDLNKDRFLTPSEKRSILKLIKRERLK